MRYQDTWYQSQVPVPVPVPNFPVATRAHLLVPWLPSSPSLSGSGRRPRYRLETPPILAHVYLSSLLSPSFFLASRASPPLRPPPPRPQIPSPTHEPQTPPRLGAKRRAVDARARPSRTESESVAPAPRSTTATRRHGKWARIYLFHS